VLKGACFCVGDGCELETGMTIICGWKKVACFVLEGLILSVSFIITVWQVSAPAKYVVVKSSLLVADSHETCHRHG
jgi:hypothetical protein